MLSMKKSLVSVVCVWVAVCAISCAKTEPKNAYATENVISDNPTLGQGTPVFPTAEIASTPEIESDAPSPVPTGVCGMGPVGEVVSDVEGADYSIIKKNGQCYLLFDDESIYDVKYQPLAYVPFDSMKEFYTAVTTGKLTNNQKQIAVTAFKRDDIGILTCSFDKMYEPSLPTGEKVSSVSWSGTSYSFGVGREGEFFGFVSSLAKEDYEYLYQYDLIDTFFNNDAITITDTETDGNKEVYYCYSPTVKQKRVRYTLCDGEKNMTVDKKYIYHVKNAKYELSSIRLFCTEEDSYCKVYLHGADSSIEILGGHCFTEEPTDEWLLQFGLRQYDDSVVEK